MESENIQNRLGWVIQSDYWINIIKAKCENFLNFYKITAYIISYKYCYKVDIFLDWEHCSCFFDLLEVKDIETILGQIEEYIINNYASIYWLPKFISILKELELQYVSTFSFIEVKFPFFTDEFKFAKLLINIKEGNFEELVRKYQNYLLSNWKTIEFTNGIEKYIRE